MKIKNTFKKFGKKIKEFFKDEYGGNLVEYALLIGFALFIFFLIVSVVVSMLDWTIGQSDEFFKTVKDLDDKDP